MRIGVLSDCVMPTRSFGGHGLGRVAWDVATGLKRKGHEVTLYAGAGSEWDGEVVTHSDEVGRVALIDETSADVWLDMSHFHAWASRKQKRVPTVSYVMDLELKSDFTNIVVANEYQAEMLPLARVIPLGIDVDAIPFYGKPSGDNLVFASKIHYLKGYDIALQVAQRSRRGLTMVGRVFDNVALPSWVECEGEIDDNSLLWRVLGISAGLLATSRKDAGGRVILEAAACGTPTLTFDWTGCKCHVEHGVSGWVCESVSEMVEAVGDLDLINPVTTREWVADCHGIGAMIDGLEDALSEVVEGGGW